jgi:hypothetical protein
MEVDKQMMASSTLQQVELEIHITLIITREEVNLHASDTNLFAPRKLFLSIFRFV